MPLALVERLAVTHTDALVRYVACRFPQLSHDLAADAVADALAVVCATPGMLDNAWNEGGERAAVGLMRVIAWRFARAQVRRACWRHTLGDDKVVDLCRYQEPDQEYVTHVRRVLPGALIEGARRTRARDAETLAAAVADRLITGQTDGAVAERHDVCREQINKARGYVLAQVRSKA